jgi:hypothetical protein
MRRAEEITATKHGLPWRRTNSTISGNSNGGIYNTGGWRRQGDADDRRDDSQRRCFMRG